MKYCFTKKDCQKCEWLKDQVNLEELNVTELDVETIEGLSGLAFYELVSTAETLLPILVLDDMIIVTGAIAIRDYLLKLKERKDEKDRI